MLHALAAACTTAALTTALSGCGAVAGPHELTWYVVADPAAGPCASKM